MQRIITSRKRVSIRKDQGWYSESEMKTDLKWTTNLGFKETCAIQKNYPSLWLFTSLKILQCTAKSSCQGHELLLWRSNAWPKNENTTMWGFVTSSFPLFYFPFPKPYYHTSSCACQEEQVRWCCWVLGDDPRVWVLWGGAWSGGIQEIDFQGFPLCLIRVWNATMCLPKNHQLGNL